MTHEFRIYQKEGRPGQIENILNDQELEYMLSIFENSRDFYVNSIVTTYADDRKSVTIKITSDEQKYEVANKLNRYVANINNQKNIELHIDML